VDLRTGGWTGGAFDFPDAVQVVSPQSSQTWPDHLPAHVIETYEHKGDFKEW
jgi:hypothetical protein